MANFYLFRHGETYFSKNDIPYGDEILSASILPEAKLQLTKIGDQLKDIPTDANFSSPVLRCLQSIEIVSALSGKHFTIDSRLTELMEPTEPFDSLRKRLTDFLEEIKKQNYQSVAICTHGACVAGLKHLIEDGKFELDQLHDYPPTGVIWTV